jgi:regulatory protein
VARLAEEGLQSDARYVEAFVQSRINQGKGPERIRTELRERRLNDAAIEQGLDEAGVDWRVLAADVRRKKFGRALPSDFAGKAKQMRFLQYRGFESDQVQAAVSEVGE